MARPSKFVTPEDRIEKWKKLWATPKPLTDNETDDGFDEFVEMFVPRHMRKSFLKTFGVPKAAFGNRFFMDGSVYHTWDTKIAALAGANGGNVEVTVIYASLDRMEGHRLTGERRRSLRDIVIDDWHTACAIVRAGRSILYVFVEPKMRGCVVRTVKPEGEDEPEDLDVDGP